MRLSAVEHAALLQAIRLADAQAIVYLFGSRVDDAARGGDIDLLVLSKTIDTLAKLDVLAHLHRVLGERKIDLVVCPDSTQPFAQLAMQQGVLL